MTTRRLILPLLATTALAAFAAGCGGDDGGGAAKSGGTAETATATATAAEVPGTVTIKMTEFKFDPDAATAKAGTVTIAAPNDGKVEHELVLLETSADPAKLPMKGAEVEESSSVGEIADVPPGAEKQAMFKLKAGSYAMVCNLPGHYTAGMYGTLTVQ